MARRRRTFSWLGLLSFGRRLSRGMSRSSSRRRKPLPWVGIVALVLAVMIISGFTVNGCTGNRTVVDDDSPQSLVAASDTIQRLAGRWQGKAHLNESKLSEKKSQVSSAVMQYLEQSAAVYRSTQLSVDFQADGTLSYTLSSNSNSYQAKGRWKIVSEEGDQLAVDVEVTKEDGTVNTSRLRLQFVEDGNYIAMVAPTGPELSDCQPLFIFSRTPVSVAQNNLSQGINK